MPSVRKKSDLFPDAYGEGVDGRASQYWDTRWVLPVPVLGSAVLECGACYGDMTLKGWLIHTRSTGSTSPWRCDVRLKCMMCAKVDTYGVRIPETQVRQRGTWIEWREGKEMLEHDGFFG